MYIYIYIERWPSSLNVPGTLRRTINFGQTIEINRTRLGAPSVILSIRATAWRTRYTRDSLRDRKSTSKIYLLSGVGHRRRHHEHDDESALLYKRTNKLTRNFARFLWSSGLWVFKLYSKNVDFSSLTSHFWKSTEYPEKKLLRFKEIFLC